MDFVKYETPDNNSVKVTHCKDCSISCDDYNEQSLNKKNAKNQASGG